MKMEMREEVKEEGRGEEGTPRFLLLLLLPATQCALIEQSSVFSDVTPVHFYLFTVVSCLVHSNRERSNYFIKSLDHQSPFFDTMEDIETLSQ